MVSCCLKKMGIFSFSSPCSLKARNTPNKERNHPLPTSTRFPKAFLSGPFPSETQCHFSSLQFSHLVKSDSVIPWSAAYQASLSITSSRSLLKLMSIESVMPSNHLILCCPLLLLISIFPIISVFSDESVLCISWPKYWSFSFGTSPSVAEPSTTLRVGELRVFTPVGPEELMLQALTPEQRDYRVIDRLEWATLAVNRLV